MGRQNSRWKDGWKSFTIPATKWLNGWCSHDFFARVLAYYFGKINDFAVDWIYWSFLHVYLEYSEKGPFSHRTWRMESTGRWWNGLSSSFQTQLAKCGRTWRSVSAAKQMNLSSCHIILAVFDTVYSVAFKSAASLLFICCLHLLHLTQHLRVSDWVHLNIGTFYVHGLFWMLQCNSIGNLRFWS